MGGGHDMLKLVEQWPPSTCNSNQCIKPLPHNFTVHGLWPDYKQARGRPTISCTTTKFDFNQVKSLELPLKSRWPTLLVGNTNEEFWRHEWSRHGTCSEAVLNQTEYFTLTLKLKDQFDFFKVLTKANITPGKSYAAIQIYNTVKQEIGTDPHLRCNNKGQLHEIVVCYDQIGANPISCLYQVGSTLYTKCHGTIYFPVV